MSAEFIHTIKDEYFCLNYYYKKNIHISHTSIEQFKANNPHIYIYINGQLPLLFNEFLPQKLEMYDTFIIPHSISHEIIGSMSSPSTIYSLQPYEKFYEKFNDIDYTRLFAEKLKISGKKIQNTDIPNILRKFQKYSYNFQKLQLPIFTYLFYEIMYLLNSIVFSEDSSLSHDEITMNILAYIDDNFKHLDGLDEISSHLNFSTSYLSARFKKNTGITILDYIIKKRLANAIELYKKGSNLTNAALLSGFSSYDSFAYTYKKIYKVSPKKDCLFIR